MNQSSSGLFPSLFLLTIVLIVAGVIGSQLWQAVGDINKLKSELAAGQKAVSSLNETIQQKDAEIQGLQAKLQEAQKGRENAESQVTQIEQQLATVTSERDRIRSQFQGLTAQLEALKAQLENLKAQPKEPSAGKATQQPDQPAGLVGAIQNTPLLRWLSWLAIFLSGLLVSGAALFFSRTTAADHPRNPASAIPAQSDGNAAPKPVAPYPPAPEYSRQPVHSPAAADYPGTAPLKLTRIKGSSRERLEYMKDNNR